MNFSKTITILATAGALALPAAAAQADSLYVASPNAQNLSSGGGYMVWSTPTADGSGFQLTVRAPDGTTAPADIPVSKTAYDANVGTEAISERPRKLVAIYSRDGDVYELDLRAGTEDKVTSVSTSATEKAPSITYGGIAFVRTTGTAKGVYVRTAKGTTTRIASDTPRELQYNGSRVAYPKGSTVVIRRVSGRGAVSTVKAGAPAFGLSLTRYSLTFATRGGKLFQTNSFGGSGREKNATTARAASQSFPASLDSVAFSGVFVRYWADAEGIHKISTQNVFRR